MPGVRFADVRARVTMAEVLGLTGFVPSETSGDQVRGPCPIHRSDMASGRCFSANVRLHIYRCFKCGSSGNHLDLYASVTGLGLFDAAVELCERLQREIPWVAEAKPSRLRVTDRSTPGRSNQAVTDRRPRALNDRGQTIRAATVQARAVDRNSCALSDRN
jgi:DNA primase